MWIMWPTCPLESESHSVMSNSLQPYGLYSPWNSPGQNTGVGSCSLLQGIFLTQGSNWSLLHCRRILDHLSHQGSPFLCISQFKNLNPDPRPYLESFNGSLLPTKSRSSVFFPNIPFQQINSSRHNESCTKQWLDI